MCVRKKKRVHLRVREQEKTNPMLTSWIKRKEKLILPQTEQQPLSEKYTVIYATTMNTSLYFDIILIGHLIKVRW